MTVLERIKEVSKLRGYNLTKVNEMAHLGKNTIYSWKTKEPSHNNLQAVADVLGVSVDYLLGNTDEMHSNKKDDNDPVDLDKVLSEEGMAMFDGQPLSDEYKKALLAMLKTMKGND
ncbi:XRE family transcriptional regulator [Weissella confusa]|uniref:XRE family transcriptional regulator n=1 Tax=Weissella confusa TaxID=1583 RepID=UPI001080C473|nr:XRE family transcriptional regulator [Weissella confusa]TGE53595.1 XRE family transcriptional regulator [Weissella confusa]TGE61010.1 XRE family transcriptional regulator [Weissella confusa]